MGGVWNAALCTLTLPRRNAKLRVWLGKASGFSCEVHSGKTLGAAGAGVWEPSWEGDLFSMVLPPRGMELDGEGGGKSCGVHNARCIFLVP